MTELRRRMDDDMVVRGMAALRLLDSVEEIHSRQGTLHRPRLRFADGSYRLIVLQPAGAGNVKAAATTTRGIDVWNPQHVLTSSAKLREAGEHPLPVAVRVQLQEIPIEPHLIWRVPGRRAPQQVRAIGPPAHSLSRHRR